MPIEIYKDNLLERNSGAVILTVDGRSAGLEGNIAGAFARLYPDAWEELEYEIQYPIPLGASKIYEIEPDIGCPFRYAIIASTLHHVETLTDSEKLAVAKSALNSSLLLASFKLISTVNCGLMSGGWRLSVRESLESMIEAYIVYSTGRRNAAKLKIYVLGDKEFKEIGSYIGARYPKAIEREGSFELVFA